MVTVWAWIAVRAARADPFACGAAEPCPELWELPWLALGLPWPVLGLECPLPWLAAPGLEWLL